ncbi:MAG: DUF58 domain-containing protein [Lachnospiraceae bacterium]|nr:DUF58 domain-containing protein [Lachnospiraceae bacterium]
MYWILLLGLFAAWIVQSVLIRRLWQRGLSVALHFRDTYVYEGDTSVLQEIVTNDKWLPLPALEVRIAMNASLKFTGEAADNSAVSDQSYKRDVFSLLFHQKITRTLSFTAEKRGCYEIRQADIKVFDFFFHDLEYKALAQNTMLYVYPAQIDSRRIDVICTAISGSLPVQNQVFPDPFEFSGIREYLPSDPMNRINWKASTRMGTTMVNQFDATTNMNLSLIFDVEDSHIWKSDALVEETIRITSSLAARLVKGRMPLQLYSNASLEKEEADIFSMRLPANAAHMAELNRKLACIDGFCSSAADLLAAMEPQSPEQLCVLISKNTDAGTLEAIRQFAASVNSLLWVIPKYPSDENPVPAIPHVRTIEWEVTL